MANVAIVRCADYSEVAAALSIALDGAGGLDWVTPGMKIALKVNLVSGAKPESAVTTHPALVSALAELLIARGAKVRVGDSPGGLYTSAFVGHIYSVSGMRAVEDTGARLNQDFSHREVQYPDGHTLRRFQYTAWLDWADAIIDVCKLKTHGMMGMSCAAKNLFGAIPGTLKPEYHFHHADPLDFANMIVDLDDFIKPRLCICDAVIGMEGNGPTAGTPRFIGAVLAAENPHALDLAAAHIIGLSPEEVPTLMVAQARGYIPQSAEMLPLAGDLFQVPDYQRIAQRHSLLFSQPFHGPLGRLTGKIIQKAMCSIPAVEKPLCIGCEKCKGICPPHAISMQNHIPRIDRSACIRCFCCQEFCPKGAIKVKRPLIAKILGG